MLIIAHRGASGYAPENTLAAMDVAIRQGCDAIECDVQMTRDGYPVVCHDWTVDRTTNGTGAVEHLTLEEIRKFDAGSWFSKAFAGEKIPTLEEVMTYVPDTMLLNIEIKNKFVVSRDIEKKVVDLLIKYNRIDRTIVSSFNHLCLHRIKSLNRKIKIAVLLKVRLFEPWEYLEQSGLYVHSFHPRSDCVTPAMVRELQARGVKVYCWTINELERAKHLEKMGVDGIITDFPAMLMDNEELRMKNEVFWDL